MFQLNKLYESDEADLDLEFISISWSDVLDDMKMHRKVAWILLANSFPIGLDGNILTIGFSREGDAKGFKSSNCDKDLAKVLRKRFGVDYQIEVAHGGARL